MATAKQRDRALARLARRRVRLVSGWRRRVELEDCPFHSHAEFEIVHHPTGHGVTETEAGERIEFVPGSFVVYPPRQTHNQTMSSPGEDVCVRVEFEGDLPPDWRRTLYVADPGGARFRADIDALSNPPPRMSPLRQAEFDHRAASLLLGLIEQALLAPPPERRADPARAYAEQAERLILENHGDIGRVADVAKAIGISEDYLRHVFRRRFGVGLKQFLIAARLQRAEDLLSHSDLPLKAVAELCGFSTERYFCTVFRERRGLPPGAWRAARRQTSR